MDPKFNNNTDIKAHHRNLTHWPVVLDCSYVRMNKLISKIYVKNNKIFVKLLKNFEDGKETF
jgi:hypothetical protein